MGLFSKRKAESSYQGGKLYKIINSCSIVGLFVAVGIIVLMIGEIIPWSSTMVGLIAAVAILCFSCILALPWIRKIEQNEFKILSYVFLGIVGLSCVLWLISDIVVISQYKVLMANSGKDLSNEESLKLVSGVLRTINFLKASVFISIQFSVASFIATGITKYKKTMIPFQSIAYLSYLFCDFWFSSFLFTVNINSNVAGIQAENFGDTIGQIFRVNEKYLSFLVSKIMLTLFLLAITYVIISNAIIRRQEQTRLKHTAEDISKGRVSLADTTSAASVPTNSETPEEKLAKLKKMYENELISKEEYESKKSDILKDM